jgi:hypothetical protein
VVVLRATGWRLRAIFASAAATIVVGALAGIGSSTIASAGNRSVFVRTDDAVVRESPNEVARPLAHPARGDELMSFGVRGDWVNVLIHQGGESRDGWIHRSAVADTMADDSSATVPPK